MPTLPHQRAGEISDIWFETTWRNATPWDKDWTYTLPFDDTAATAPGTRLLVFDGVKMGAEIKLNGVTLGVTADQFLRYVFPVSGVLKPTGNTLEVAFSRGIDVHGRYMGCTGGWDVSSPSIHRFVSLFMGAEARTHTRCCRCVTVGPYGNHHHPTAITNLHTRVGFLTSTVRLHAPSR